MFLMRHKPQFGILLRPALFIKNLTTSAGKCIRITLRLSKTHSFSQSRDFHQGQTLLSTDFRPTVETTSLRVQGVTRSSGWGKQYASHILPGPRLKLGGSLLLLLHTSSSRHLIRHWYN